MPAEHDLLDQFLQALSLNPDAPPPIGLDPSLAEFVRRTMRAEKLPALSKEAEMRLWQEVLNTHQMNRRMKDTQPMLVKNAESQPVQGLLRAVNYVALMGAAILVVVILAALLAPNNRQPESAKPGAMQLPSPTVIPTSTPILPTVPPIVLTLPSINPSLVPIIPLPPIIVDSTPTPIRIVATIVSPNPLSDLPTKAIPVNTTLTDTLREDNPRVAYRFTVPQDGMLDIVATARNFSISLGYSIAESATRDFGGGGGSGGGPNLAQSELFSFVRAGNVITVVVDGQDIRGEGQYTLGVYFSPVIDLGADLSREAEITPSAQMRFFRIIGNSGERLNVRFSADPSLDLYAHLEEMNMFGSDMIRQIVGGFQGCITERLLMCTDDDSGAGQNPEFTNILVRQQNGYGIFVRATNPKMTGKFTVTLERTPALSLDQGAQIARLSWKQSADAFIVQGKTGVSKSIKVSASWLPTDVRITVVQLGQILGTLTLPRSGATEVSGIAKITGLADTEIQVLVEYLGPVSIGWESEIKLSLVP